MATMTTYILTITSIENGEFNYSVVEGIYRNLEDAKLEANTRVKMQSSIWGVKPNCERKVKGHLVQVSIKHPTMNVVKVYSLQAMNNIK